MREPASDNAIDHTFHVHDAGSANWVVRKIVEAHAYAARARAWAAAEVRRAERDEQFLLLRYGQQLEDWVRQQIAQQHDGRQSVNLPAGRLGFRTSPSTLVVTDERALMRWCREHLPSAVRTVESVTKSVVTEHVRSTGECADGVELRGGVRQFYVSGKNLEFVEGGSDAPSEEEAG